MNIWWYRGNRGEEITFGSIAHLPDVGGAQNKVFQFQLMSCNNHIAQLSGFARRAAYG